MSVFKGHQRAKLLKSLDIPTQVSGVVASDLVTFGNAANTSEQTLASVNVKSSEFTNGLRLSAWGSFGSDINFKTIKLKVGSTVVAVNDVTLRPSSSVWELEATLYKIIGNFQVIGGGIVGAVLQSRMAEQFIEADIIVTVTGQVGAAVANAIISRGLVAESI
jgi:hypothetical protein